MLGTAGGYGEERKRLHFKATALWDLVSQSRNSFPLAYFHRVRAVSYVGMTMGFYYMSSITWLHERSEVQVIAVFCVLFFF